MRKYELDISYEGNMPNEVEFTLDDRYVVKIGDERFYNLMGETMLSAFNGLVHPDDVTTFEHFVNSGSCKLGSAGSFFEYSETLYNINTAYMGGVGRVAHRQTKTLLTVRQRWLVGHGRQICTHAQIPAIQAVM